MLATSRYSYTPREERLMWEYLFQKLQEGDPVAYQPKGLRLWKNFRATGKTNKTVASLSSHFRKVMFGHIEGAEIPVEHRLYIASQLNISLSETQKRIIEFNEDVSITTNDLGVVVAYEKDGEHHIASSSKVFTNDDKSTNDDLDDGGSKPSDSSSSEKAETVPNNSKNLSTLKKNYNFRERPVKKMPFNVNLPEEVRIMEPMSEGSVNKGDRNNATDQTEDFEDKLLIMDDDNNERNEPVKTSLQMDRGKDNNGEWQHQDEIGDKEEDDGSSCTIVEHGKSTNSNNSGNQLDCLVNSDTRNAMHKIDDCEIQQHIENGSHEISDVSIQVVKEESKDGVASSSLKEERTKSKASDCGNDDELKQVLAHIVNKKQLKGVEKLKMTKILELRAKEAKQEGISLKDHLMKIRLRQQKGPYLSVPVLRR